MTQAPLRTFRPQDLRGVYTQPGVQLHRLTRTGRVKKAAHGFYYAVPDDQDPGWTPSLEGLAAGIATAVFGDGVPVLMHLSAARLYAAVPRAIGAAYVAVPRQHTPVRLVDRHPAPTITFITRNVDALDAVVKRTDLGNTLVTGVEQTVLDLAKRPDLGELTAEAHPAIRMLWPQCDPDRIAELAGAQRMTPVLRSLQAVIR